jgi:hypothetical protein
VKIKPIYGPDGFRLQTPPIEEINKEVRRFASRFAKKWVEERGFDHIGLSHAITTDVNYHLAIAHVSRREKSVRRS